MPSRSFHGGSFPAGAEASSTEQEAVTAGLATKVDPATTTARSAHVSLFGARAHARTLVARLAELQEYVDRLGLLSVVELEER
jgi:hypothetical protein